MDRVLTVFFALVCFSGSLAEKGYFWHVTDFHYDHTYNDTGLSCNADVPNPGPFGDYWCDSPWRLVEDTVQSMAAIKKDVDFIIWTGDTVAHIKDADLTLAVNLEVLENATRLLNESFPNSVAFYPSLGNHDFYPSDQADVVKDEMYNGTSEIWRNWIDSEDQLDRFMKGGFYHKEVRSKLRLLSLNTNLYYTSNDITEGMADPAGQFEWMDQVLTQARTDGEKVIVIGHIPPGIKTPGIVDWLYADHQERLINILTNYSDIIVASHYGHDHSDGFKVLQDSSNADKAIPQFVAPSVTPWRFKIPNLTGLPHNPGVRLVEYDRNTGAHLDYVQYFINLTDTNANGSSNWEPLYSFTESYGVSDMSVKSLRDIFTRMKKDDGGKELAQKYCNYAVVSTFQQHCPDKYRWEIVCGGHLNDMDETKKCVGTNMAGSASSFNIHLAFYFVILIASVWELKRIDLVL